MEDVQAKEIFMEIEKIKYALKVMDMKIKNLDDNGLTVKEKFELREKYCILAEINKVREEMRNYNEGTQFKESINQKMLENRIEKLESDLQHIENCMEALYIAFLNYIKYDENTEMIKM